MKKDFTLDVSGKLQQKKQKDQRKLQIMFDEQKENFNKHVSAGVKEILKNSQRELSPVKKQFRKLQLRSWFIALMAAGLMLVFQVVIFEGRIPQMLYNEMQLWFTGMSQVERIHQDDQGIRWMLMNTGWNPTQDKNGRYWIRIN